MTTALLKIFELSKARGRRDATARIETDEQRGTAQKDTQPGGRERFLAPAGVVPQSQVATDMLLRLAPAIRQNLLARGGHGFFRQALT